MADPKWKQKLRKASFRGIPFGVTGAELEGGRRAVTHEFVGQDTPGTEDLGRKAKQFSIDAFVVGENYQIARDALLDALDQAGPGELVHPYYGEMSVQVTTFRISESMNEGGMAKFSITFAQAGELSFPTVSEDEVEALKAKAEELDQTMAEWLLEQFADFEGGVFDKVAGFLDTVAGVIDFVLTPITVLSGIADKLSRDLNRLVTKATTIARKPLELAYSLQNSIKRLMDLPSTIKDTISGYKRLFANIKAQINGSSDPGSVAVTTVVKASAASASAQAAANAATSGAFQTSAEVNEVTDSILEMLDEVIDDISADESGDAAYKVALELRVLVAKTLPKAGVNLRDVVEYEVGETVPSIVLAHELYGDLKNEQTIIDLNNIRKPAFITGGSRIEVLQ